MKLTIRKEQLILATSRIQGVIQERSQSQIAIKAEPDSIHVSAMDRVLAVYSQFVADVIQPGIVVVTAKLFSEVVKELPDGIVTLSLSGSHLVIEAGAQKEFVMKLPIIEDQHWQPLPTLSQEISAEVPSSRLAYMIEQVQFCVASDSPRNYGTVGFLHRPTNDTCRLVGTDGYRLSYCEVQVSMPEGFLENGIALSKRALTELHRMCGESFEKIRLSVTNDQGTILAQVPDYQIFMRLTKIKYPSYYSVIPEKKMDGVLVSRGQLQSTARRVLLASDKSRALQLSFCDASLTLNSKTIGSSEGRETVPLPEYRGGRFEVAINGKYLMDVFSTIESENLSLHFNIESKEEPIVIEPRHEMIDCRSKHVLVPIKQND